MPRHAVYAARRLESGTVPTLGAISLKSVAASLGTDTKTLLLLGGGGIFAGYLLNSALTAAGRSARRVSRRVKRSLKPKPVTVMAPSKSSFIGTSIALAIVGGAAYYVYQKYRAGAFAHTATPKLLPPAVAARHALPVLQNGHWTRP
jgi:hypothetical protein